MTYKTVEMDSSEKFDCSECEKSLRYTNQRKTACIIQLTKNEEVNNESSLLKTTNSIKSEKDSLENTIQNDSFAQNIETDDKCHYNCIECGMTFTELDLYEYHQKRHCTNKDELLVVDNPFKCPDCGISFPNESLFNYHCKRHKYDARRFQCSICDKLFGTDKSLIIHQKKHSAKTSSTSVEHQKFFPAYILEFKNILVTTEQPNENSNVKHNESSFQCAECGVVFEDKYTFDYHDGKHCNTKRFKCKICFKSFKHSSLLDKHMLVHADDSFVCTECGKHFSERVELVDHCKTHIHQKPFKCTTCHKTYASFHSLKNHYRIHLLNKPFMCSKCNKCFPDEDTLNAHSNMHDSGKYYHCIACAKCFSTIASLQVHYRTHTGEKPYLCSRCDRSFSDKSTLLRHIRVVHTNENQRYKCSICLKFLKGRNNLKIHMERHTFQQDIELDISKFVNENYDKGMILDKDKGSFKILPGAERQIHLCMKCGKSFGSKFGLDLHLKRHSGEKPHLCSRCGKTFLDRYELNRHYKIHTGEKPFKCLVCSKCFTDRTTYKRHCQIHTNEKPYVCHICAKSFITKISLTTHIRYHTGEKPYKCSVCHKAFAERGTLTKHHKIHDRKVVTSDMTGGENVEFDSLPLNSTSQIGSQIAKLN